MVGRPCAGVKLPVRRVQPVVNEAQGGARKLLMLKANWNK